MGTGTTIENAFGGDGNDTIIGNSAANILHGGRSNDTLDSGVGNDTLTGGVGCDRFTFNYRSGGIDRITDFSVVDFTLNFELIHTCLINFLNHYFTLG
ncbi:M10 family metallopeptidase C-terminal domain-containing protein [Anabaena sp. CCY 9910]|uniref:M10 family metallopeptidase C-terminal domain-containing protein n=1 Tax=Anabaena sp. CCY 9910 TaxID=3103870 RepID=UPI0039E03E6A